MLDYDRGWVANQRAGYLCTSAHVIVLVYLPRGMVKTTRRSPSFSSLVAGCFDKSPLVSLVSLQDDRARFA